jgi:hypothetical protein
VERVGEFGLFVWRATASGVDILCATAVRIVS